MKKTITIYALTAAGLILITGLFALVLGITDLFSQETAKYITEAVSSVAGSIYLSFLLGRIRQREWENKRTKKERLIYTAAGLGLAAARTVSRLTWTVIYRMGRPGMAYVLCIILDLLAVTCLWFLVPGCKKEVSENA